jgi:hypothetical protein
LSDFSKRNLLLNSTATSAQSDGKVRKDRTTGRMQ